mmetsp:Transcript_31349/g.90010  ORF Transcript_31349/g.90010 Transcript_31349/m.90010 type:complete len:283 (-) Transcript_31349:242-1090(-)
MAPTMEAVVSVSPPRSMAAFRAARGSAWYRHATQRTQGAMCTLAIWKSMPLPGRRNLPQRSRSTRYSSCASLKFCNASAVAAMAAFIPSDLHRPSSSRSRPGPSNAPGTMPKAYCTAAAWAKAKSTASGCRWLASTASVTARRKTSGAAPRYASASGEMRMAPPLAKEPPSKGKCGGRPVSWTGTPASTLSSVFFAVGGLPRKASLSRKSSAQHRAACPGSTRPHSKMEEASAKAAFVSSVYMPVRAHCFATFSLLGGPTGTQLTSFAFTAGRYCPGSPAGT